MAVVGIDLGTTHTVIAAVRDGRASALKDKLGRALLPSVVSFPPKGDTKIGYEGRDRRTTDPTNTIYSTKRLIGRPFESEAVRRAIERFPFELKAGAGAATLIACREKEYSLPEISGMILQTSRVLAEARLGSQVSDAVITVPAHFNDLQRAATKLAGKLAGLEVLRILNEPTAAALAYGFGKKGQERIAIYDFGGGTFDITILDLAENVFEVLATAGDTFLGGDDIDRAISERMAEELQKKNKIDATNDPMVSELLRVAAEKLKLDLSTRSLAKTRIDDLSFDFSMRRAEFEQIAEPFVTQSLAVCKQAMETADIESKELNQVLLVGGSTRIPLVRRRISSFFNKMPQSRINPDEVVAIGAALQANALTTQQGSVGIPSAPIPRASGLSSQRRAVSVSRPPKTQAVREPAVSTQVGLAGLKAPSTSAKPSDRAPQTLSGVGAKSQSLGSQTLSGTGTTLGKTLSGVGAKAPAPPTRNAPPPPRRKASLPATPDAAPSQIEEKSEFEDITSVYPDGLIPQILSDSSKTLAGMNDMASANEPAEDGSVVFDLAELEAEAAADAADRASIEEVAELPQAKEDAELPQAKEVAELPQAKEDAHFATEAQLEVDSLLEDISLLVDQEDPNSELSLDEDELVQEQTQANGRVSSLPIDERASLLQNASQLADASDSIFANLSDESTKVDTSSEEPALPSLVPGAELPALSPGDGMGEIGLENTLLGVQAPPAYSAPEPEFMAKPASKVESSILEDLSLLQDSELFDEEEVPSSNMSQDKPLGLSSQLGEFADLMPSGSNNSGSLPLLGNERPSKNIPMPPSPLTKSDAGNQNAPQSAAQSTFGAKATAAPLLIDVTPLSLGVEVTGGYVEQLLEKGTPIPSENTRIFATTMDKQTQVKVRVCQGDSLRFSENTVLGEVALTQLDAAAKGQTTVEVIFALDESGVLNVSAKDPKTGVAQEAQLRLIGLGIEA